MEWSNTDILYRLVLAHLIADFLLQSDKMTQEKREKKITYHLLHSLIHAALAYLLAGAWSSWAILPVIFTTHLAIDYWKIVRSDRLRTFLADQFMHLTVIIILWLSITSQWPVAATTIQEWLENSRFWLILIGYLLILKPASIVLGLFTRNWRDNSRLSQSLNNGGQWIGYLERVLILTFVLTGNTTAVGFLLAAKSIFRFGELSKAKEIKTTEYVLIGTLASFAIAIITGLILTSVCK